MKERGILFSDEMVRAILDGRKTQTRRVLRIQPPDHVIRLRPFFGQEVRWIDFDGSNFEVRCPFGKVGDRLWVRECFVCCRHGPRHLECLEYRADEMVGGDDTPKWTPSIHMPRWASRITLEITDVRVQRLHDISQEDALAEGVDVVSTARNAFCSLWCRINGGTAWDGNPWVWALTFKRVDGVATESPMVTA